MGIWVELGVFVLALAFGLWQIHDVKKARQRTQQLRAQEHQNAQATATAEGAVGAADTAKPTAPQSAKSQEDSV